jgi:DNA replication protein DnaC
LSKTEYITLDTLDTKSLGVKRAVTAAKQWSRRKLGVPDASMVIVGPVGTGKTHIALSMLWSRCMAVDGEPVCYLGKFYIANDLIQDLGDEEKSLVMLIPGDCPILVLDDVGSERQIAYIGDESRQVIERRRRYFSIINHCYVNRISVIITSNLSLVDLEQHIGGRSWSRLQEMCPQGFMIAMGGVPDWRRKRSGRGD